MELARYPLAAHRRALVEGIDAHAARADPGAVDARLRGAVLARATTRLARVVEPARQPRGRARRDVDRGADPAADADALRACPPTWSASRFLVAVALFGDVVNGARRWLHVGVTRFQPSEMMKIAVPLMLAWYFHRTRRRCGCATSRSPPILLVDPVRPDRAPARPRHRAAGRRGRLLRDLLRRPQLEGASAALGGARRRQPAVPALGLLHDYQRQRVLTLLDPTQDPLGAGYHTIQSTIAVGSGGLSGKGWLNGTQAHLEFIPERHTDFIFAVFSEEFGLIGNLRAARALRAAHRPRAGDRRQRRHPVRAAAGRRDHADVLHLRLRQHGHGVAASCRWSACRCRSSPTAAPRCSRCSSASAS